MGGLAAGRTSLELHDSRVRVGSAVQVVLVVIDLFVALTAVGGGIAMAADIDKKVDPAWLEGTPFQSYRVPGVLLAGIVGGTALLAAVVTALDATSGGIVSVIAGVILAGWIVAEVIILNQPGAPTAIEVLYVVIGLSMISIGLAVTMS